MSLGTNANMGDGGQGFHGDGPNSAEALIKELQGLNVELLAGAAADTKIDVAAIRSEDTVLKALNNNAGTITDITSTISINALAASGTLQCGTVTAGETVQVNGATYTFQVAAATTHLQVQIGASATISATNLKNAINLYENRIGAGPAPIVATSTTDTVTVTATTEGTAGNAIATVGDTNITAGAATLAGGTATGGIQSTGITNQVILFWYNKNA